MTLTLCFSRRNDRTQLVRLHHECLILYQLDGRLVHLLAFSQSSRCSTGYLVYKFVRLEVQHVASCACLAHDNIHASPNLLHLRGCQTSSESQTLIE